MRGTLGGAGPARISRDLRGPGSLDIPSARAYKPAPMKAQMNSCYSSLSLLLTEAGAFARAVNGAVGMLT